MTGVGVPDGGTRPVTLPLDVDVVFGDGASAAGGGDSGFEQLAANRSHPVNAQRTWRIHAGLIVTIFTRPPHPPIAHSSCPAECKGSDPRQSVSHRQIVWGLTPAARGGSFQAPVTTETSAASISALCISSHGGSLSSRPSCDSSSSAVNPGSIVATSNSTPPGSLK